MLIFCSFCREGKRWKLLGAKSGEYGGLGKADQLKSNNSSYEIPAECGLVLSYWSTTFFLLTSVGHFLWKFSCSCCSCLECKSALNVLLQFKESKWIILCIHTHSITFFYEALFFLVRLQRFILINPFALIIVIKNSFFIIHNDILEKLVISLSWKKTSGYGYVTFFLFFSLKV